MFYRLLLALILASHMVLHGFEVSSQENNTLKEEQLKAVFTPPQGWRMAEKATLPKNVHIMVVGQGKYEMPPSINLGYEPFKGSLKDYLKVVKQINDSKGDAWKDLGTINTEAGPGSLSQLDTKTQWGPVRMMHLIFLKDGVIYILTASARKEEFPHFYKDFFSALKSFHFEKNSTPAAISP